MTLLSYADISARTGVPINTLRSWLLRGKLPPPDEKPNRNVALWKQSTIEEWESTNEDL